MNGKWDHRLIIFPRKSLCAMNGNPYVDRPKQALFNLEHQRDLLLCAPIKPCHVKFQRQCFTYSNISPMYNFTHTYINSHLFPMGVGRNYRTPPATILTYSSCLVHIYTSDHTRTPVASTTHLDLSEELHQ